MKHVDLFSGIGGFSLAASWVWPDHRPLLFCEVNEYCQKVLSKHWPEVVIHDDIKTLDATGFRGTVDLLTGGFPCQPYSTAGERRGSEDDRALWPEMLRIIEECRPRWVVGENVAGFAQMVEFENVPPVDDQGTPIGEVGDLFHRVGQGVAAEAMDALKSLGYAVQLVVVPAVAVDAQHRRDRIWIMGHAEGIGRDDTSPKGESHEPTGSAGGSGGKDSLAYSGCEHCGERLEHLGSEEEGSRRDEKEWCKDRDLSVVGPPSDRGTRGEMRWIPEPAMDRVVDGVPHSVDRIRALGNAIVPQVAAELFRMIAKLEEE